MDWLQIVANIAQIVGLCWPLAFGGRAIFDVIRAILRRWPIRVNPIVTLNVLVAAIIVILIGMLVHPILLPVPIALSSHNTSTPTTSPTEPYPPPNWKTALIDPLTQPLNWQQNGTDSSGNSCQFKNGAYHVILPKAGNGFCAAPNLMYTDLAVEVTMTIVLGDCGTIWFRGNGPAYDFEVCQDGVYHLYLYSSSGISTLLSRSSTAVHTGHGHTNVLAVVAIGSNIDLYVNHQKINSATNGAQPSGDVNFGAAGGRATEVAYKNAMIWTP